MRSASFLFCGLMLSVVAGCAGRTVGPDVGGDASDVAIGNDHTSNSDTPSVDTGSDTPLVDTPSLDVAIDSDNDSGSDAVEIALDAGTDAGTDVVEIATDAPVDAPLDSGYASAPHAVLTPLASRGGPILASPGIVTITYMNDANRVAIENYGTSMTTDPWWAPAVSEYGVGPVSLLMNVRLTVNAPATSTQTQIESFLRTTATAMGLPTAPGTIYMLYFPTGSNITLSDGATSCSGWHGVHGELTVGTAHISYALSVGCGPARGFTDLQSIETAASHELMEAATDPFPNSNPAYETPPGDRTPWAVFGELTDRCVGQYLRRTGYVLARNWSNAAAAAGTDPCVPPPAGSVYYNVTTPTTTVHGPAGTVVNVPITGWSEGPVPNWNVSAQAAGGFNTSPTLDSAVFNNGISTMLHLTIPAGATSGSYAWVLLYSGPSAGDLRNYPIVLRVD